MGIFLDCSVEDYEGSTPLVVAAKSNDLVCMQLLIAIASGVSTTEVNGKIEQPVYSSSNNNKVNKNGMSSSNHKISSSGENNRRRTDFARFEDLRRLDSMSVSSLSDEEDLFQDSSDVEPISSNFRTGARGNLVLSFY